MEGMDPARETWGIFFFPQCIELGKKSGFPVTSSSDGKHWKGVWELVKTEEKFYDFCALQIQVCVPENLFSRGLCP